MNTFIIYIFDIYYKNNVEGEILAISVFSVQIRGISCLSIRGSGLEH